jgi:hypothetical protein
VAVLKAIGWLMALCCGRGQLHASVFQQAMSVLRSGLRAQAGVVCWTSALHFTLACRHSLQKNYAVYMGGAQ